MYDVLPFFWLYEILTIFLLVRCDDFLLIVQVMFTIFWLCKMCWVSSGYVRCVDYLLVVQGVLTIYVLVL